jgi:YegS/Rv2252/BmrU family lipid kinase
MPPSRDAVLIANPRAGQGSARQREEALVRFCNLLKERGIAVDVRITEGPRDATRLAAAAMREGYREVIISGGDGTINEALQGLVGANVRLAIWPRGTANVLGRELRLPRQLPLLADVIAAGKVQRAFAGCATFESTGERRYFLLMAGIGIDAAIVDRVRPGLKKRVGKAAYWYSGLENFARWSPRPFRLEIEGQEHVATFAALGKAPRYGGDLLITPRARLDLPHFEICVIHSMNRLRYLKLLPFAMFGGIPETMKEISFLQASQARATGDGVLVQADGELIGELPMTFTVTPHVVDLVTP